MCLLCTIELHGRIIVQSSYVHVEISHDLTLLSTDATSDQRRSWVENGWQTLRVRDDQVSVAIGGLR